MIGLIIFTLALLCSLVWYWVGGIDYMLQNHPDYKGKDFLNIEITEEEKQEIQ